MTPDYPHDRVMLARDGDEVIAWVGRDLVEGMAGFGNTAPRALRDLANNMERLGSGSNAPARHNGLFLVPDQEQMKPDREAS